MLAHRARVRWRRSGRSRRGPAPRAADLAAAHRLLAGRHRDLAVPGGAVAARRAGLMARPRPRRLVVAGRHARPAGAVLRVPVGAPAPGAARRAVAGPSIESQLAGNALAKVAPGGGAIGAALQYRLLVESGVRRSGAVTGVTTSNVLVFAVLLGLPVLALPAIVRGARDARAGRGAVVGAGASFVALTGAQRGRAGARRARCAGSGGSCSASATACARSRPPLPGCRSGCCASATRSWPRSGRAGGGRCWPRSAAGPSTTRRCWRRWPRSARRRGPVLVLLAFTAAQVLALVPVTPGGLGFVEAGLTATLALAGVGAGNAVLATFAYRLFNFWLPLPAGPGRLRRPPSPAQALARAGPAVADGTSGVVPLGCRFPMSLLPTSLRTRTTCRICGSPRARAGARPGRPVHRGRLRRARRARSRCSARSRSSSSAAT